VNSCIFAGLVNEQFDYHFLRLLKKSKGVSINKGNVKYEILKFFIKEKSDLFYNKSLKKGMWILTTPHPKLKNNS
jgi:hypothetical protein